MKLPEGWKLEAIKNCCTVVSGSTPRRNKSEYWENGCIPWVTPKDLSRLNSPILEDTPEKITKLGYDSCSTTLLPKGSILFSSRAPIGHVAIAGKEMCTNQGFKSLIPNDSVNSNYLYWCMRQYAKNIESLGSGSTFKEVSKGIVEKFKIPLPPIAQQRRIACILDKADEIRRKRQEAIKLTEELGRSLFLDMFGDPVTNPNGWELSTLFEVCKKITDGTHHSPPIVEKGVPYITAKHLKNYNLDFYSNPWFVSEEDHQKIYSRCNPEKGDVLYIKDGVTTGMAAINNYDFKFSMLSSLALLKVGQKLTSEYLCDWLNNENVKKSNLTKIAGVAITRLTLKKIKNFQILLPPLYVQQEYIKVRKRISNQNLNHKSALKESENLFNSLLQRAFKGEL